MTEPATRSSVDRVIIGGAKAAFLLTVVNVLVGALMAYTDANNSVGQDVGMLIVIVFFLGMVGSALLHLVLLVASAVRGFQGAARSMRGVYIYLVGSVAAHVTAAALLLTSAS